MSRDDALIEHQRQEIRWLRNRVDELENKLMHLADKPWAVAPSEVPSFQPEPEQDEWVSDPGQLGVEAPDPLTYEAMATMGGMDNGSA